jgi:8-oxo-dGTP pyrophosphatase MutT (NUDIX family)
VKPIRNSAKALIVDNNKVLAIKLRDKVGFWYTLPGGGQDPGETLVETLKRECFEEIGAEVEIRELRFIREYIGGYHEFAETDGDVHAIEFMFECRLADGAEPGSGIEPDPGQLGVEWLEISRLDKYRLYPLALRPLIGRYGERDAPIYLGDVN